MQLATREAPKFFSWESFIADGKKDEPPIADRLAVRVSEEAAYSLVDFESDDFYHNPEHLGWDFRRLHGGPHGAGYDMLDTAMATFGKRCSDALWASFDRPRANSDRLLIDVMDEATHCGWDAPPEIAAAIEALRQQRSDNTVRRKAGAKARDDRFYKFCDFDEAGYGDWLDAGRKPDGHARKVARWKARDADEEEELARIEARRALKSLPPGTPMPANLQLISAAPQAKLIQSSREFVANFVAPSFLIDGVIQKQNVYALTAAPGTGKTAIALRISAHVALGRKLGDRDVERGRVLYFAAENYVDVQARLIAMAEHCGFDVNAIDIYFVAGTSKLSEIAVRVTAEAQAIGDLTLVIVDTSAATFEGSDENSNVDGLIHAKRMRSLTELRGKPTVVVLCHPVKSATNDNLLPRGGSAFFGEIDGNLCARKSDSAVEMHWFGKIRGMDFAPIAFRLDTVVAERLKDARGRKMPTVLATPIDDAGKLVLAATERSDQDRVLRAIFDRPGESSNEIAKHLGWAMRDGKPYGVRVRRAAERMAGDGLLIKHRGEWVLSPRGEKELNNLDRKTALPSGTSAVPVLPPLPARNAH